MIVKFNNKQTQQLNASLEGQTQRDRDTERKIWRKKRNKKKGTKQRTNRSTCYSQTNNYNQYIKYTVKQTEARVISKQIITTNT